MSHKKEYLLNINGKIKECPSNVAKMNLYEYLKTFDTVRRFFYPFIPDKRELEYVLFFIIRIIIFGTLPISAPIIIIIGALRSIKKAKKEVNEWKARNKK